MCGISFACNSYGKAAAQRAYDTYKSQKGRGSQGFGYVAIEDGKIVNIHRSKSEYEMREALLKETASMIMLHHRFPTSTINTVGTTHPISVSHPELKYDYLVIHNGVVSNDDELKKKHNEMGYNYTTEFNVVTTAVHKHIEHEEIVATEVTKFNDSECLAIELARFIEGKDDRMHSTGGAAFIALQIVKGSLKVNKIFYGQNHGRSLGRKDKKGWTIIASETGKQVTQMKLYSMSPKNLKDVEERDLMLDEAFKTEPSPYQNRLPYSRSLPERSTVPATENNTSLQYDKDNKYSLVDAYYSYDEAIESGAPLSEFYTTAPQWIDGKFHTMYVPKLFRGTSSIDRPFFRNAYHYEIVEPAEEREEMEELAMKIARKAYELEYVNEAYVKSDTPYDVYRKRKQTLEKQIENLEQEIYTMGFDAQEVSDTLDTASQLVQYEYEDRRAYEPA